MIHIARVTLHLGDLRAVLATGWVRTGLLSVPRVLAVEDAAFSVGCCATMSGFRGTDTGGALRQGEQTRNKDARTQIWRPSPRCGGGGHAPLRGSSPPAAGNDARLVSHRYRAHALSACATSSPGSNAGRLQTGRRRLWSPVSRKERDPTRLLPRRSRGAGSEYIHPDGRSYAGGCNLLGARSRRVAGGWRASRHSIARESSRTSAFLKQARNGSGRLAHASGMRPLLIRRPV